MSNMMLKAIEKWHKKREIRKICKANGYFCPYCIHHEYIFDGVEFRGTRCRLEKGAQE